MCIGCWGKYEKLSIKLKSSSFVDFLVGAKHGCHIMSPLSVHILLFIKCLFGHIWLCIVNKSSTFKCAYVRSRFNLRNFAHFRENRYQKKKKLFLSFYSQMPLRNWIHWLYENKKRRRMNSVGNKNCYISKITSTRLWFR